MTEPAAADTIARVPDPHAPTQPGLTMNETLVPTTGAAAHIALPAAGYQLGSVIGAGGMGEVLTAHDQRIGREVAVKRMRASVPDQDQVQRFLREARIQARLDHPAIVPVHELNTDAGGRPYFTMKKLTGRTLAQRLADGASLNRLLRVFVEVCHAVEFAHARGVVHRDLKPSNIMLGEYGEVYVIDWGIARVITDHERSSTSPAGSMAALSALDPDATAADSTQAGALLGTPGYMSPEQVRGDVAGTSSDVYSLGAILFELLTTEPLHPRGHQAAVASTIETPQMSPLARKPDRNIAPELDAVCQAALHEDARRRPTAHELAEAVQLFLDGDRDVERRRRLAGQQVDAARQILETDDPDARATAMRRAGRALALDPESREAAELVGRLLLEPPNALPPDLAKSLDEHERQLSKDRSKRAIFAYLSIVALAPAALVIEVQNWAMFAALYVFVALGILTGVYSRRTGRSPILAIALVNVALAVVFTRIAGPFILTPLLICCVLASITPIPWFNDRTWAVVTWTVTAVLLPIALEWAGVLSRTWAFRDDAMVILGDMFHARPRDEFLLTLASLVFTVVVALVALGLTRKRRRTERAMFIQAWHLRQLLPSARRPWQAHGQSAMKDIPNPSSTPR